MCNRHLAHLIADYEDARLEATETGTENPASGDPKTIADDPSGSLATVGRRLFR